MLLNLSRIINIPGQTLPFELELDLSDMEFYGAHPVMEPVKAVGLVRNTADVLVLTMQIKTTLQLTCDRCVEPFRKHVVIPVEAILSEESSEDSAVFQIVDDSVDLVDIVTTYFVLNMDSKSLCRDDCKGLCERCGQNLNEGPCRCKKEIDPRLAGLQQFLKDK